MQKDKEIWIEREGERKKKKYEVGLNHIISLILGDLAKAFDTVSGDKLLQKLKNIPAVGNALDLLKSNLIR